MIPPHLLCLPEKVAGPVLLPGDPHRAKLIAGFFDNPEKIAENREFLMVTGHYSGIPVSVCSTGIGSPSAVIALEELCMCGADTFIRVGTCGALQRDINTGDIIIPTAACRGEGTSQRYVPLQFPAVAHPDIVSALREIAPDAHTGIVWTDDSFYISESEYWSSLGILAVEMECSSLFTVSSLKKVRTGAILAVDGNLLLGTCKKERRTRNHQEEISEKAREGVRREIKIALEAISLLYE
ncbi:MAG: nucleoside phosphorylase [Theionarchaea archaeon]|nr:nucleoside phosphorylase [Theionarchaea archaeon]